MNKPIYGLLVVALLSGCGVPDRIAAVGKAPRLSPTDEGQPPLIERSLGERGWPTSAPAQDGAQSASLFKTGAGAFLRDQRASRRGDILTIRVNITDRASFANTTSRSRSGGESAGLSALLGLTNMLTKVLPGKPDPAKLIDAQSESNSEGAGNTTRSEEINMTLAGIVTDVLPNGNLLIRGRQEVRVNFELRELVITGIIRPEDIGRDNSIRHSQIAEARVVYGGRGQLTDLQQARWGKQIYEALFPF